MFNIRDFTLQDLSGVALLQLPGWTSVTEMFKFYYAAPFCFPQVAIDKNQIIAIGSAIVFKGSGWLAHIIVAPEHRCQGLGQRMTETLINILHNNNCVTKSLVATDQGEPVYTALGFRISCQYHFFKGPQLYERPDDASLVIMVPADLPDVFALDRKLTGEARKPLLNWFIRGGWVYRDIQTNDLRGYYIPDLGEGTILAKDPDAGLTLLSLKHHLTKETSAVPESNHIAKMFLLSHGFSEVKVAPRMVLGDDVLWNPFAVFSRISGFCA
jgi:GNAT superfamily N-acetyltransferase